MRGDYRDRMVIQLNSLRDLHEHGYRVSVFCRPCGRHVFLDLPALVAAGVGERAVVGLSIRCTGCGRRGEISVIWDCSRRDSGTS